MSLGDRGSKVVKSSYVGEKVVHYVGDHGSAPWMVDVMSGNNLVFDASPKFGSVNIIIHTKPMKNSYWAVLISLLGINISVFTIVFVLAMIFGVVKPLGMLVIIALVLLGSVPFAVWAVKGLKGKFQRKESVQQQIYHSFTAAKLMMNENIALPLGHVLKFSHNDPNNQLKKVVDKLYPLTKLVDAKLGRTANAYYDAIRQSLATLIASQQNIPNVLTHFDELTEHLKKF